MRASTKNGLLALLLLMVVAQIAWLASSRGQQREQSTASLSVGETLNQLSGLNADGAAVSVAWSSPREQWTALLAFHSERGFCDLLAEEWREWLETPRPVHVIAISGESIIAAGAYAEKHGWNVNVLALDNSPSSNPHLALIHRTPWLFLVDPQGVLRYEGHGSNLSVIDEMIREAHHTPEPLFIEQ